MRIYFSRTVALVIALTFSCCLFAQTVTQKELLLKTSSGLAEKEKTQREKLLVLAKQKGWDLFIKTKTNKIIGVLVDVDGLGIPMYHITDNNITAAATIGTNQLWAGGSTGLNLSGSSNNMKDKMGLWEAGNAKPLSTHVELTGRILQKDNPTTINDHATHVAGTLIASGVNPLAKGMSYGLQELIAYDANNDNSEMAGEAPNLLISNHSYGFSAGWNYNDAENRWEFFGASTDNEDYKFGYYSSGAQIWDSIAYNAPYYLIVKSAGNNRNSNGPAVGEVYWRYNDQGVMANAGNRPAGISSNDGYDILSTTSTAKNILVVGAVNPISSGYSTSTDVQMSAFSSWGPTDDGRIKPDVVADGVNVLSSTNTSNNAYAVYSGTSMSAPNASGSLLLLQEHYSKLHGGNFMRAATLKGIAIHTADEAGAAKGPDYKFGWGLLNIRKAAQLITDDNAAQRIQTIQENVLTNGSTFTQNIIASGNGPISATISWTDPKATVESTGFALDNTTRKLVNDLDIVIKKGATIYRPWILDPANPDNAATTGDNVLDNVEKVEIPDAVPGDTYTIEIKHKGTLARGQQAYSLLVSGVGGQVYCTSGAMSTAGARIDSVSFANIRKKNPVNCTSYSDFKQEIATVEPNQTLPFFIRMNSCDATSVAKMAKVYMDINNDGDFLDAGELLTTSSIVNGNGDANLSITIPVGLATGKYTILRIVMQETNTASTINPCGTYTNGETQDYRVFVSNPSTDVGVTEITAPLAGDCQSGEQFAAIRIKNFGATPVSNIPVSFQVKQGATVVTTLNGTFTGTIAGSSSIEYTFQVPFITNAATNYTLTATTNFTNDQVSSNNQTVASIITGAAAPAPTGTAVICGTTATLTATSTSSSPFNWYSSAVSITPLVSGASTSTPTIQSTYYLSTGEVNKKLGPANKNVFTSGGYSQFGPGIRITTSAPTTLKTARLHIGNAGKVIFHLRELVSFDETNGTYQYYAIADKTLDVVPTTTNPAINDPADAGAIYTLNIAIPEAKNYILAIEYADGATIFRNNNIAANPYPYVVPGLISLTGNTVTTASPSASTYYYYLYDVAVKPSFECPSPRVAITAVTKAKPTVTVAGAVVTSSAGLAYQWYLNGNPINGAINQSYTATTSGNYSVETTDNTGCALISNAVAVTVTTNPNPNPNPNPTTTAPTLSVSPNPSKGQFVIKLETTAVATMEIVLMNAAGQIVYQTSVPGVTGTFTKTIEHGHLASGVYYLRVKHNGTTFTRRLVLIQ